MERSYLEQVNQITAQIINSLYGSKYAQIDEIEVASLPNFRAKYLAQIALINEHNLLSLYVGFSQEVLAESFEQSLPEVSSPQEKEELNRSLFGEIVNMVACDFAAKSNLESKYHGFQPTVPLIWNFDGSNWPDFIEGEGYSGKIRDGNLDIHTHLACIPGAHYLSDGSRVSWNPTHSLSIRPNGM